MSTLSHSFLFQIQYTFIPLSRLQSVQHGNWDSTDLSNDFSQSLFVKSTRTTLSAHAFELFFGSHYSFILSCMILCVATPSCFICRACQRLTRENDKRAVYTFLTFGTSTFKNTCGPPNTMVYSSKLDHRCELI